MKTLTRHTIAVLVTALLVGTLGCKLGTGGSEGNFNFRDPTPGLEVDLSDRVERPVAVGAKLRLLVKDDAGEDVEVESAETDDDAILRVVSTGKGIVVVEGVAKGGAELRVTDASGVSDRIDIDVEEVGSTTIHVLPWTPLLALPERVFEGGFVILPDSPVEVFAEIKDPSGQALSGFAAQDWSVTEGAEASVTPQDTSDFATLRSGQAIEAFSLLREDAAEVAFETVAEESVGTMMLYSQTQDVGPTGAEATFEIEAGKLHFMHVAAYIEDGRYIVGPGSTPIEITLGDDAAGILEIGATPQTAGEDLEDEEAADDLARILANGRAFTLSAQNTGETTLTITWLGKSETFPVRVVAGE